MATKQAWLVDLGHLSYGEAWAWQRRAAEAVWRREWPDTVALVEHPPVYTIGRAAHGSRGNLLLDPAELQVRGIELYEVDRGGDITYHGPGQIVAYPIIDLNDQGRDLHRYLRNLEEAVMRTLAEWNIQGMRSPPHTGVWVGTDKVAAIGVKASHWISQHGLALNVCTNLDPFQGIVPCGIRDKGVTSMERCLGRPITPDDVKPSLIRHLGEVLRLDLAWAPPVLVAPGEHGSRRPPVERRERAE